MYNYKSNIQINPLNFIISSFTHYYYVTGQRMARAPREGITGTRSRSVDARNNKFWPFADL